jgi:DNA modification methylase
MSKPNWTPVQIRLGDLIPWGDNPKYSTKEDAKRLLETEQEFGQPIPFCVSPYLEGSTVNCYDGHQRDSAWRTAYGDDFVVWAMQSDRHLTEAERKRFVLRMHNAHGQWSSDTLSGWDADVLKSGWFDSNTLKGWKADVGWLDKFLQSEQPSADAEPQVDRAAELLEKWQVTPGSLWQIGEHRLICGDCTDAATVARVMDGERAQVLSNDPPYGMGLDTDYSKMPKTSRGFEAVIGDDKPFDVSGIRAIFEDVKEQFWFGADYYAKSLGDTEHSGSWMVWDKRVEAKYDDGFGSEFELVWSAVKRKRQILRHMWFQNHAENEREARERLHPTQKPTSLIEELIGITSDKGDIVFDGFLGSGTTLVACENLSRRCRAIEISPSYVAVALERMATAFPALEIRRLE